MIHLEVDVLQLCEFKLFERCKSSTVKWLCSRADCANFSAGDQVLAAGVSNQSVGFLTEGRLCVRSTSGVTMRHLSAGCVFGVGGADCGASLSTVTADQQSTVAFIPLDDIMQAMADDSVLAANYVAFLSGRIKLLNSLIAAYSGQSVERKTASFLLAFYCDADSEQPSLVELSNMLGVGRASLYRVLDSLEERGAINRHRNHIDVTDKNVLISIIEKGI